MAKIFTLDARENVLLEVMREHFNLSSDQIFKEINGIHNELISVLETKGIKYEDLKTALIPTIDKQEYIYVFDTQQIESDWYGYEVFKQIIPQLNKKSNQSVLSGDLLDSYCSQKRLKYEFERVLNVANIYEYKHSSQFYLVYFNNTSRTAHQNLQNSLSNYPAYTGFINISNSGFMKSYCSTILCNTFIKHKNKIIMSHEEDRDNTEDINMIGFPFETSGFECRSLSSLLFDLFLSYKIEREVSRGFESDVEFSLNAISNDLPPLNEFSILIDDSKLEYLKKNKTGKLKKANLLDFDRDSLELFIRKKLMSNYFYNMEFLSQYNTIKFNINIEVNSEEINQIVKLTLALEYIPNNKIIRVITMY